MSNQDNPSRGYRGRGRGRGRSRVGPGNQPQRGGMGASQALTPETTQPIQTAFRGGGNTRGDYGSPRRPYDNHRGRSRGFGLGQQGAPSSRGFEGGQGGGTRGGSGPYVFAQNQPAIQDERLATSDSLIDTLKKLSIHDPEVPVVTRPNYGTLGTPITLRANFFAVKVPEGEIYDYTVTIQAPEGKGKDRGRGKGKGKDKKRNLAEGKDDVKLSAALKAHIFAALESTTEFEPYRGHVAHDKSQRLVSSRELPQPLDLNVEMREESGDSEAKTTVYAVKVEFKGSLNMAQLTAYVFCSDTC